MPLNYYKILGLNRSANVSEVKLAYRTKSVLFHPHRVDEDHAVDEGNHQRDTAALADQFAAIAEAYVVLSSPRLRAVFDQYGESRLKQGAPNENGVYVGGWVMVKTAEQVFSDFFGANSPFADLRAKPDEFQLINTGGRQATKPKTDDLAVNLYCSLEELFVGCSKRVVIRRQRVRAGDGSETTESHTLNIPIRAGWKEGTVMTFPGEGNGAPGKAIGDVKVTLREKPHPLFTRKGRHLVHVAEISLREALTGCTLELTTLDRQSLVVAVDEIVQTGSMKTILGLGMPSAKKSGKRGNIRVEFKVRFPERLSISAKTKLKQILPEH